MEATLAARRAERERERRLRAREDRRQRRDSDWEDGSLEGAVRLVECTSCKNEVPETALDYGRHGATCGPCFEGELDARARQAVVGGDVLGLGAPVFLTGLALAAPGWAQWDMGTAGWSAAAFSVVGSVALTAYAVHRMGRAVRARRLAAEGVGLPVHPASWSLRLLLLGMAPIPAALGVWAGWVIATG